MSEALVRGAIVIALAPLAAKPERFGIPPTLEFLGSGAAGSDYLDLVIRNGSEVEAIDALAEYLAELVSPGDIVLVKGSRGLRMEDVVTFLTERLQTTVPMYAK